MTSAIAPRRAWITLAVILSGMFISLLDSLIVNVALPSIRTSLHANESELSWVVSGYALGLGLALIPAGRIGDRIGHKWVFILGLALFTATSMACGLSQNGGQLVIWRVLQGVAGGIYIPAVGSFIQLLFTGKERGRAFGIMGAVIGLSSAIGLIVGGLIIQVFGTVDGWRWVFFVNLPIGVFAVIASIFILPGHERNLDRRTGLDLTGALILAAGLVAILVPLIDGQQEDWPLWTWLSLGGGVLLLVVFAFWEIGVARRGSLPLVPPSLFHHSSFTMGMLLSLIYFAGFTSIFFTVSILWQAGLGHTALESGLFTLPIAIGTFFASMASQRLVVRLERRILWIGVACMALGLSAFALILLFVPATGLASWMFALPLFVSGVGNGFFLGPNAQFIIATVENSEAGAASGVINTAQRIGTAIGVAIISSILFGTLSFASATPSPAQMADAFAHSAMLAMSMSALLTIVSIALVFALPKKLPQHR